MIALLGCASPPARPDLLLVTVDTTRADAVGAYGAVPSPTPHLDGLAVRGLRVEEAMSTAPVTLPSHTALLTGRYPDATGVHDNLAHRLGPEAVTLAERLRDAGWQTGAFVSAAVLDRAFGLDQGFDTYHDTVRGGARRASVPRRPGDEVAADAVAWLAAADPDRPVFAWVHLYDAHQPHQPSAAHRARFPDDPYAAGIADADAALGAVLAAFRAAGRDPVVAVVGDHGESNGEHGERTHGWFAYRSTLRVPLVVAGPGVPARVLAGPASTVDLVPTLLARLGLPPDPSLDGLDLLGPLPPDRVVYGESWTPRLGYGFAPLAVAIDARHRYVDAPRPELYDWTDDPTETQNRHGDRAVPPGLLAAVAAHATDPDAAAGRAGPMDDQTALQLAALGYVGGAAPASARDPKDDPRAIEAYTEVMLAARTRPPAAAIPLLEGYVAANPGVAAARLLLSRAALLADQPEVGLRALDGLDPSDPQVRLSRAVLSNAAGREAEGMAELRALRLDWPDWTPPRVALADALRVGGDCAAAVQEVEDALRRHPDDPGLRVVRADCREAAGDLAGAVADLDLAVDADPAQTEARLVLASLLLALDRPDAAVARLVEAPAPDPRVERSLALARHQAGELAAALPALEAAAATDPTDAEVLLALADALLRLGADRGRVPGLLDRVSTLVPGEPQVHAVRARWWKAEGRLDEAQREAERWREAAAGAQ